MPSADNPPSLLSRLSPAVPVPIQSHAADHGPPSSKTPFGASPASPPVGSPPFVGSPSRASRSPRKGNHFPRAAPGSAHIAPLPEEVLQKSQPIPVERSTNSSRWATAASSSSPTARSPAKRTSNAHPTSASPHDLPGALDSSSPNRHHHRPSGPSSPASNAGSALGQLESMLSQMRTASVSPPGQLSAPPPEQHVPSSSPRNTSASPRLGGATSPRSPSFLSKSPSSLRGVAVTANPPALLLSQSPKSPPGSGSSAWTRDGTRTPKKPVLGGKSKWAVTGDNEPDEHASVEDQRKAHRGRASVDGDGSGPTPKKGDVLPEAEGAPVPAAQQAHKVVTEAIGDDLSKTPTPSHPAVFASRAASSPTVPADRAAPAHEEDEEDTDAAESVSSRRSSISSSIGSDAPSQTSSSYINWADDDLDDELPTLDDWGIDTTTSSTTTSDFGADTSSAPSSASATTGSSTPAAAAMPHLGSKRHHPARAHRSPPAPTNAKLPPAGAPGAAVRTPRAPIKPNGRLFASAARAAVGGGGGHADTPPHLVVARNSPAATPSPPPPPTERSWRDRAAGGGGGSGGGGGGAHPNPVVFSRLSGMTGTPSPARKGAAATPSATSSPLSSAPPPAVASPTPPGHKSRKPKKGKGRGGGGAAKATESAAASSPVKKTTTAPGPPKPTAGGASKWA